MPYAIAVQRPESDAPVSKTDSYLQWYSWAKDNAPFTSATLGEWAGYLMQLTHPSTRKERRVMATSGTLAPNQIMRLLVTPVDLPVKVVKVFEFAAQHGYPVSFTPTGETALQYLEKQSSA